ncbi:MAG: 3-deoxy-7-phosphoheptulonate synthase [Myxococcales bacterium]|jgi:3-deoxy-7-phosphoheptulonate synthase|nr:3-deoxy-7-phosphoheptulonate synthase [Myxococcales bacterium]
MISRTDDVHIDHIRPLIPPAILIEELPLDAEGEEFVVRARREIADVVHGRDDRLVVVVGPCSVHDTVAALDYANRLAELRDRHRNELLVVMRTYFEKPRTTVGWKGLINDPFLDGSFEINKGLHLARSFLRDVVALRLPTGTEFLDPISPQFVADLVCWGAIGARTTESQVHRELASGLSMPVGFKNGTRGSVQIAVDAVGAATKPHRFLSVTKQGLAAIVATTGNESCHVILRGGSDGPNYGPEAVAHACELLVKAGLTPSVMIDCSHANSGKSHERQADVAASVAKQVAEGSKAIFGVMLESFLVPGAQKLESGKPLVYGQSITDACMGIDATADVLAELASAVEKRRAH